MSNGRRKSSMAVCTPVSMQLKIDVFQSDRHPGLREEIEQLNRLWKDDDPCDIMIQVQDQQIYGHKSVLTSYSPYFSAMFLGGLAESQRDEVELFDVDATAVEDLINFAYNGRTVIGQHNVQALLQAASLLHLQGMEKECCRFLHNELDPSNCLGISQFADFYSYTTLASRARNFAKINFKEVVSCEEFFKLTVAPLLELFLSNYLYVENEQVIYESAMSWLQEDSKERLPQFSTVLNAIHFSEISPTYLNDVIFEEAQLKLDAKCLNILNTAANQQHNIPTGTRKYLREMLVVVGGLSPTGVRVNSTTAYQPATDSWKDGPALPEGRSAVAVEVLDDLLYVSGGTDGVKVLSSVQRFDPRSLEWSVNVPNMLSSRAYHALTAMNGNLFAAGGWNKDYDILDSSEMLDAVYNTWFPLPSMAKKRRGLALTQLNNIFYACGGHNGTVSLNTLECFDPRTERWEFDTPMLASRSDLACVSLNGYLYALGGSRQDPSSCERFEPRIKTWEVIASMNHARPHGTINAKVLDDQIYVIGGSDRNVGSALEKYDLETNSWFTCQNMESSNCDAGLAVMKL